jgi:hypothetical protein
MRVGDMSPESARRHRAADAQRVRDYRDRLTAAGLTARARQSEAAMAHEAAVIKSQRFKVAGVRVWVPVSAREQSAEELELNELALARRSSFPADYCLTRPTACI